MKKNVFFKKKLVCSPRQFQETAFNSWRFFRKNPLVQDITFIDLLVQILSFLFWNLYLSYTAMRCVGILFRYLMSSIETDEVKKISKRRTVWKQVQLYTTTKVTGIVLSQIVLVIAGISSIYWAGLVLLWGGLLGSISCFAYQRSYLSSGA